jgi:mannitol/fructose-specific phosphotransferase system IIA component (Ntr-type)
MHVADRLASVTAGSITLFRPIGRTSTEEQLAGHRAYHDELAQMCRAKTDSIILRSGDHVKCIAEFSADYDLLILGGNPEGMFRTLIFGSEEHKIADEAACSVLKVKSPRHKVHPRFVPTPRPDFNFDSLETFISWAAVDHSLTVSKKEELFRAVGARIAEVVGLDLGSAIARKISKRDHRQTTQLPGGVALIGTTKTGLPATTLGLFTTASPIPWNGPYPEKVDVVIVVASPPGDRQVQLWMLGRLARIILLEDFLTSLRAAESRDDILRALEAADENIDSFYSSVEITQPELPRLVLPEEDSIGPQDPLDGDD